MRALLVTFFTQNRAFPVRLVVVQCVVYLFCGESVTEGMLAYPRISGFAGTCTDGAGVEEFICGIFA